MIDVIWREDDELHSDSSQIYNDCLNLLNKAQTKDELNRIYALLSTILTQAYAKLFKSFS